MHSFMGFFLKVSYVSPSNERMFLEEGWGLRDVRGPYVEGKRATLNIGRSLLSYVVPSKVSIRLSASNRATIDGVLVDVSLGNDKKHVSVPTNSYVDIDFDNVIAGDDTVIIEISIFSIHESGRLYNIIAVDEIVIERFYDLD